MTYFELKGEDLLERLGVSKAEFARRMGIQRQNVKALFRTRNLDVIRKASEMLGVPFELLVGYVEPMVDEDVLLDLQNEWEVRPEDIPTGDSVEERRVRQKLIWRFYERWKQEHPKLSVYNTNLKDEINIRHISIEETSGQASLTYLSTLAVLQLDAILQNAKVVRETAIKKATKNQQAFEKMLIMSHYLTGIGWIKLTVGVRRSDKQKIQYCITALLADDGKQRQPS